MAFLQSPPPVSLSLCSLSLADGELTQHIMCGLATHEPRCCFSCPNLALEQAVVFQLGIGYHQVVGS